MKRSVVVVLLVGLLAGLLMAVPAEAKKKKKKKKAPVRVERVEEIPYTLGNLGVASPAFTGGVCFTDPSFPASCKEVPLQAGETYIKIEVQDATGSTVPGFISQGDVDGDGISDGYGEFCGAHAEAVPLADAAAPVGISMYPGVCADASGGGIPTEGTIVVTFSNMP
ncbi:MAG: hypothetical protein ACRDKT_09345 [Actinomycetota bacterium]